MTFYDLLLAAQLMSEERVGKPIREAERRQYAEEQSARRRLLEQMG